jgi:hypothetical protein
MNCHNKEKANVKGTSPYLQPVYASFKGGLPVEWKRVHKLPEYAYFNHAVHVNKGVSCASCHGAVNEMKVVRHDQLLTMGWCLKCHDNPTGHLRPVGEVTNLSWAPGAGRSRDEIGAEVQKELQVKPPTHCQSCHR